MQQSLPDDMCLRMHVASPSLATADSGKVRMGAQSPSMPPVKSLEPDVRHRGQRQSAPWRAVPEHAAKVISDGRPSFDRAAVVIIKARVETTTLVYKAVARSGASIVSRTEAVALGEETRTASNTQSTSPFQSISRFGLLALLDERDTVVLHRGRDFSTRAVPRASAYSR